MIAAHITRPMSTRTFTGKAAAAEALAATQAASKHILTPGQPDGNARRGGDFYRRQQQPERQPAFPRSGGRMMVIWAHMRRFSRWAAKSRYRGTLCAGDKPPPATA